MLGFGLGKYRAMSEKTKEDTISINIDGGRFFNGASTELDYDGAKTYWWLGEPLHGDICEDNKKQYAINTDCAKLPIWHAWASCNGLPYQYHGLYDRNKKVLYSITKCEK